MSDFDAALADFDERLAPPEGETPQEPEARTEEPPPAAGYDPDPEQPQPEPPDPEDSGQPRDPETGRFLPKDPKAQAYLEKYGGDPEKALAAAVEAQELIGRQGGELGELRKTLETLNERLAQPETPRLDQGTVDWFDEQASENPYGAAMWAMQNDPSGTLYERAMDTWFDTNPRQAAAFERQQEIGQLRKEFEDKLSEQTGPLLQQTTRAELARAFTDAMRSHPESQDDLGEMILAAAQNAPAVTRALMNEAENGDYQTKVEVFDSLIARAQGRSLAQVKQASS